MANTPNSTTTEPRKLTFVCRVADTDKLIITPNKDSLCFLIDTHEMGNVFISPSDAIQLANYIYGLYGTKAQKTLYGG